MSTSNPQPELSTAEELVAYLDGELPADACQRVEQRLSRDAKYRQQLSELDQAWSALEALPSTKVDDDFARTTIEMVAVAAEKDHDLLSESVMARKRQRSLLAVVAGLAIVAAAFAAARLLVPNLNDALVADLPVIAQNDELTQIGDFDFLRGLSSLNLDEFHTDDVTVTRAQATGWTIAASDWKTPESRRAWIEELAPSQKAQLETQFRRYQRMDEADREQLQSLVQNITDAQDRSELEATLAGYSRWLKRRSPGEQAELRRLPTDERLERVRQLANADRRDSRHLLSLDEERALQEEVLDFVERRQEQFLEELSRQGNRNPQRRMERQSMAVVALGMIWREMRDDDRRERLYDQLTARLSPETQVYFESLRGRERSRQLWQWIVDALRPKFGPQELEQFFAKELNNDQREYLLGLPRAEMEEQLQRLFVSSQVGFRIREWSGDFGDPGRFERGRPPEGPPRDRGRGPRDRNRDRPPPPPRGPEGRPLERGPGEFRPDRPPREFDRELDGPPRRRPGGPPPEGPPPDGPPPEGPI